jgi:Tfp pilus assembly protein PilO
MMNKREKTLVMVVSGVLLLVLGRSVVKTVFMKPLEDKNSEIRSQQEKIDKIKHQLQTKSRMIQYWRSIEKQSLDDKPETAFLSLGARMTTLIGTAGLQDVSVKPIPISVVKDNGTDAYYPIAVNLSARGSLAQIVKFLEAIKSEPYIVKVTGFTLKPEGRNDLLSISNCRIESIVPAKPILEVAGKEKRMEITATQPAVKIPINSEYSRIVSDNMFIPKKKVEVTQAPVPQPVKNVGNLPVTSPKETVISQGPGKPGDLVGTFIVGKIGGAYIRNPKEVGWYKVGDRLTNQMELKFVHSLGIVMQDSNHKDHYTEIGHNIDQAKPLSERAIPELYEAYQAAKAVQ